MLKQPDEKVLEALANLEHNGNWKVVMDWINESTAAVTESLSVATDVPLYRAQGAYGVLATLHNHAKDARGLLSKLSTRSN